MSRFAARPRSFVPRLGLFIRRKNLNPEEHNPMKIDSDPVAEALAEISGDLDHGRLVLAEDQMPDYPATIAVSAAERALSGLRAVLAALGDLEPGPALIVNEALRRGLGVTW